MEKLIARSAWWLGYCHGCLIKPPRHKSDVVFFTEAKAQARTLIREYFRIYKPGPLMRKLISEQIKSGMAGRTRQKTHQSTATVRA